MVILFIHKFDLVKNYQIEIEASQFASTLSAKSREELGVSEKVWSSQSLALVLNYKLSCPAALNSLANHAAGRPEVLVAESNFLWQFIVFVITWIVIKKLLRLKVIKNINETDPTLKSLGTKVRGVF